MLNLVVLTTGVTKLIINQSINQTSIAPISLARPGSVA